MILKEYQKRTMAAVRAYLEALAEWRDKDAKAREMDPDFGFDWAGRAWERMSGKPISAYNPRSDALGQPLPCFCLKIPTGGGKTLLATRIIDQVNMCFRRKQTGMVLWIVPSRQIYSQTLMALKDRNHPYRQQLDMFSAGRTLVLEKSSRFSPADVDERLCVLLLMLPSANRETKETLRMFRDSGGFERFFPSGDDTALQEKVLEAVPNLDTFGSDDPFWGRQIKTSLGNTLRLLRPLIILDEGHKAYSRNAKKTLEGFNPCMIVELSATPPRNANVLVEIKGQELNSEEMIKLDLHIRNSGGAHWKDTLLAAVEHRGRLEEEALRHEAQTGTYIRPICLIQAERTGRGQRLPGVIHADDVREQLLRHPAIAAEHIAVKTSSRDELKEVDEAGGLLSRDCPIRFIITKQALQEGWDCSFAYVLAILTNPMSRTGLTQLVGRILRQPYARKTGFPLLDESYVFCFQRRGAELLKEVRKGFGLEGLQGLECRIVADSTQPRPDRVTVAQRERFRKAAAGLVLPAFMIRDGPDWRLVHHEADILSRVPWQELDAGPVTDLTLRPSGASHEGQYLRANLGAGPPFESGGPTGAGDSPQPKATADPGRNPASNAMSGPADFPTDIAAQVGIDYAFAASHLLDALPNPWRGHELARKVFGALLARHSRETVAANYVFILGELRKRLEQECDRLCQQIFRHLLGEGTVRFIVVANDLSFNRLPPAITAPKGKRANREDGSPYQRDLFEQTAEDALNGLENKVATYLDQQERLFFWYRNRERKDYYVQGWKRGRIYADFIVTLRADEAENADDAFHRVFVVETKGMHLARSGDTSYKRSVFSLCNTHAREKDWADFVPAMKDKVMRFEIVDEEEWEHRLYALFAVGAAQAT